MNAKKAKMLRRLAQGLTVGMPATGYVKWAAAGNAALVDPQTTDGVYRQLKKQDDGAPHWYERRRHIINLMERDIHADLRKKGIEPVQQIDKPWPALTDITLDSSFDVPQ